MSRPILFRRDVRESIDQKQGTTLNNGICSGLCRESIVLVIVILLVLSVRK